MQNPPGGHFYTIFKQEFVLEPYLLKLDYKYRIYLTKLRASNIKFPIETGRWRKINREERICTKYIAGVIGDEFHYLFNCTNQQTVEFRNKYIPSYYITNCNIIKMAGLLSMCHIEVLKNLSIFLKNISKMFK